MSTRKAAEQKELAKIAHALDARTVAIVALAGEGAEKEANANDLLSMMLNILSEESELLLESIEPAERMLWAQALRLRTRCDAVRLFVRDFVDAKHAGVQP
ncbi:MAG TPA: hypothetical protein VMI54_04185 [Polyangiaceae bacterium]|nr:hypothetical protein [Polyangiaceae bacterium]